MKDSLYSLLELQEIDKEINTLERFKEEFPEEIGRLNGELEAARGRIEETEKHAGELESNRRLMESELDTINQDLKKHQDRLYEVKSNREYDALQVEIETLGARKDEHETGILRSMEDHDDLATKLKEDKDAFSDREKEILKRIKELTARLDSVEGDIQRWNRKRKGFEKKIDVSALSTYNRIRRMVKGGVAVVEIKKGSCGGCFRQLSPQLLLEARKINRVMRCENCGRITVWREEVPV
jgi:predicted  nucleic acid-binding Zn-ribbon protein